MQRDRKREVRKPVKELEEGFRQEEGHTRSLHLLREKNKTLACLRNLRWNECNTYRGREKGSKIGTRERVILDYRGPQWSRV